MGNKQLRVRIEPERVKKLAELCAHLGKDESEVGKMAVDLLWFYAFHCEGLVSHGDIHPNKL